MVFFIKVLYNSIMKRNQGFTLVELLVVIAIIGSLASIVIGAVSKGRGKAENTKIKSNLGNMRSQAAIYFTDHGDYGTAIEDGDCAGGMFADPTMASMIVGIGEANGANDSACYTSDSGGGEQTDSWAVSSPLATNAETSWCVDSDGRAIEGDAQIVSDTAVCQ